MLNNRGFNSDFSNACVDNRVQDDSVEIFSIRSPSLSTKEDFYTPCHMDIVPTETSEPKPDDSGSYRGVINSLELHNFKSYGGTVKISPFASFTAIIGPNGSGKSNLMDAIAFVLCIRSTKLRGANPKELIHRNELSEKISDAKYAYVSLTLSGNTGSTGFMRKITEKGTITYIYNGNVVTFKEYMEALREHRINAFGSTGLIFQGAVNDIASRSPSDLTKLFENISGSSLYAKPYNYLKEKLEHVRMEYMDMTLRKKQLSQEIKQYKSMLACNRKYDDILEEYKKTEARKFACDYTIMLRKFEEYKVEYNEQSAYYDTIAKKWSEMQEKRNQLEENRAKLYHNQGLLNREIQRKTKSLIEKKEAISGFYDKKSCLEFKLKQFNSFRASLESDLEKLTKELDELSICEENSKKELQLISSEINELNDSISMTDPIKQQYSDLLQEFYKVSVSTRIKVNIIKSTIVQLNEEYQRVDNELSSLKQKRQRLVESATPKNVFYESIKTKLRDSQDSMELLSISVERLSLEKCNIDERTNKLTKDREELDEKIKSFNIAKVEYRKSLKRIEMTQKLISTIPGVHGEVLNLCKINNACYHQGIMATLNTRGHTIATESFDVTAACIEYLKSEKVGKRNFLSLELISDDKSSNRRRITDILRHSRLNVQYVFAIDCIDFENKYRPLFEHLLGDTIIVSSLDDAERIVTFKTSKFSEKATFSLDFTIVTQKGQIITRNRTIIIDSGFHTKDNQLELEVAEYMKLTTQFEHVNEDLSKLNNMKLKVEASLQETKGKLEKYRRAVELLELKMEFAKKHNGALGVQLSELDSKIYDLSEVLAKLKKSIAIHTDDLDGEISKLHGLQKSHFDDLNKKMNVDDIYGLVSKRDESLEKLQCLYASKKATQKRYEEDVTDIRRKMNKIREENIPNLLLQYQTTRNELQELLSSNQRVCGEVEQLESDIEREKSNLEENLNLIEKCSDEIRALQSSCDEKTVDNASIAPLNQLRDSAAKKIASLTASMKKVQMEALQLSDTCRMKNINCDISVPDHLESDKDINFPLLRSDDFKLLGRSLSDLEDLSRCLEQELIQLKKSLSSGRACVDVQSKLDCAITESSRMDEQVETMKNQCLKLETDFKSMRKERAELFLHCFYSVKRIVGPIYSRLSSVEDAPMNGGQAFLSLDDYDSNGETEPFFCDIRYNTMPPMKKFFDISLQSGGEKALSSLALLLALHSFRRSPFIVLDEIDANIDALKLQSLTNFLKTSPFQVIIISLKDKLFSEAESLVGVYRHQSLASSRCVVLSLRNYIREKCLWQTV